MIIEVAAIQLVDGFSFEFLTIEERKHIQTQYPGFNVSLASSLWKNINDLYNRYRSWRCIFLLSSFSIELSKTVKAPVFEEEVSLDVYPIEYIFAEKYETACFRGADNSRMKDFHDMWMIIQREDILGTLSNCKRQHRIFFHIVNPA